MEYILDLRNANVTRVIGAFSWSSNAVGGANFYIDDIQYSDIPPAGAPPAPRPDGPPTEFPITVDDFWSPTGYMGDGEVGGIAPTSCMRRAENAAGACHRFDWTPVSEDEGGKGWAGVYWQYPPDNWGEANDDGETLPGLEIPAGAQSIRFVAWGDVGGEVVSFASGLGMVDGFSVSIKDVVRTDPQEYVIDLRGQTYHCGRLFLVVALRKARVSASTISNFPTNRSVKNRNLCNRYAEARPSVDAYYAASGYMGDGEMGDYGYVGAETRPVTHIYVNFGFSRPRWQRMG